MNTKTKLTPKAIALIATAAALAVVIIVSSVLLIVDAVNNKRNASFDYLTANLNEYVSIAEKDYKNYKVSLEYADPHDVDLDVVLLQLVSGDRGALVDSGLLSNKYTVYPGDVVKIWYRGYIYDEDNNPVYVDGLSNIADDEPKSLTIGSGAFPPGFELGLVGKCPLEQEKLVKITSGEVKENQVVYVNYTRLVEGGNEAKDKVTASAQRIDLSTDVDEIYGVGFKAALLNAATIGSTEAIEFSVTLNGKKHNYTNTVVKFATECEKSDKVIKVDCYFPYSHGANGSASAQLRNENATFEVYIDYVQHYELAENVSWDSENKTYVISDAYIESKLGEDTITREELDTFSGDSLVEKYKSYLLKRIEDSYAEEYRELLEAAIWVQLKSKAVIKKYPEAKVKKIYDEYIDDVYLQFENSGGVVEDPYTGATTTYETVDEYAVAYLGLSSSSNKNWKAHLNELARDLVAERLILFYLLDEIDGIMPTSEELEARKESIKAEYISEYVDQYLEYEGKTKDDFTEDEYREYVEERKTEILGFYDDDHFTETAYYDIALDTLVTYPEVSTYNDRRAFPFNK